MNGPRIIIHKPPGGFTAYAANPFYDARREREERLREMEEPSRRAADYIHFCDSCEKGFDSEQFYRAHLEKHIWCDYPGCKFTCLKVKEWKMEVHKSTLHDRPDAPDLADMEKYIAARKKKFPTHEKILTKTEELQLLAARGVVLGKDQWRWLKAQERAQQRSTENDLADLEAKGRQRWPMAPKEAHESSSDREASDEESSCDEEGNEGEMQPNALPESLPSPYAESHENSGPIEEENQTLGSQKVPKSPEMQPRKPPAKTSYTKRQPRKKLTLFEKLTMEDRMTEKGLILQAFRYFVATDFLKHPPEW